MKNQTVDIRGELFTGMVEDVNGKLDAVLRELMEGEFIGGKLSLAITVELEEQERAVNVGEAGEVRERIDFVPKLEYECRAILKKEEKSKEKIDTGTCIVELEGGRLVLRELQKQMSVEDMEEV